MRILVGWDDPAEAELLKLYLNGTNDNEVVVTATAEEFLAQAGAHDWGAVLLSVTFPKTIDQGFAAFSGLQKALPGVPLVMACRPHEMISLPKFLNHGLRFYVFRDAQGDFIFLLLSTLESAVQAAQAEQSRKLAEQLREEINGVRLLQEAIIPRGLKVPAGYRAAARYEPSQVNVVGGQAVVMAGGDYYDLFCPDAQNLVALIGDASGHGLKACMSIMTMHTLVRMLVGSRFRDTAAFVTEINNLLCANSIIQSGGGFITMLYATVDTASHEVCWSSAGHPPALMHRLDTNEVVQVGKNTDGGMPLGIADGADYESFRFVLPPNSRLLLYSDGLTDAFPLKSEGSCAAFGVAGITRALQDCRACDVDKTLDYLFHSSHKYTGDQGRHDDTSVLLLERTV